MISLLDYSIYFDHPQRLDETSAWIEHIPFGMLLIELLRPKVVVELGTHVGVSYCAFCQAIKKIGLDARSYAIDTWKGDEHAGFYGENVLVDLQNHHDPLYGSFSRLVRSTFDNAVQNFADASIDLLHIDGLHTYEAVKHDFETWLPKLSRRAVVLIHDTNVRERGFGVWKFWHEVREDYPHFEFIHGHGLGVLCIGEDCPSTVKEFTYLSEDQTRYVRDFFFVLGSKLSVEMKVLEKERTIKALSAQLSNTKTMVLERDNLINTLRWQLEEIQRSLGWRAISYFRKIKEKLAPPRSKMARFLELLFKTFLVLHTKGLRAAYHKAYWNLIDILRKPKPTSIVPDTYVPIIECKVNQNAVKVKVIAFYLPQYHPIPENDEWWGRGFTEWTNVSKAMPNFVGHYQPHIPGELGYYDLRLPEVQERQIALAKKYGIYGFCFYYYWFHGKRLLERPVNQYLANPHLDLPFCLCWANENWTRRWDGAEHDILIAQEYNEEQYGHFIRDISVHFSDPRYIRVDGKPMLLVYRVNLLPDAQKAAEIWRVECRKMGIGEIYLVAVQSFGITDPRPYGFDAAVEFPPSNLGEAEISRRSVKITNPNFRGHIFDYNIAVHSMLNKKHGDYTVFKSVMPSWDNTARKQNDAHIFINSSPAAYQKWLEKVVAYSQRALPEDKRFVFVNAWNEWAEGTHLEPDTRYGYAYLQATAQALTSSAVEPLPPEGNWTILFISHDANYGGAQSVLLSVLGWFKTYTSIRLKVLCLEGGELLPHFNELADTIVWSKLQKAHLKDADLMKSLLDFCSGAPDLVYGNTVVSGQIYETVQKTGAPILTHFHEMEMSIDRYGRHSISSVLKHSSHYIACSEPVKRNLVEKYSVDPEKISVIYSAITPESPDGKSLVTPAEKRKLRAKMGLAKDGFLVFGCGIGMPFRKGADLFIETARALRQIGVNDFHFYWVGDFPGNEFDENQRTWNDYLRDLKKDGLDGFVTFLGLQKNVRNYLSAGDVFLLPSREDPFPLVALEAAECGLPIVCFDRTAGGMPDFVGEDAGIVVPFEDVDALASAVLTLKNNEELKIGLGIRAREKFLNDFTVERIAPRILSACRKAAGKKPAVSIIVPNYNHEKYLAGRLDSIFGQSFRDFEVILLDDNSTDNSLKILERYSARPDVTLLRNETNTGSPFAQWLKGIDKATADIIWIAESDDLSDPEFLRKLLPAFRDPYVRLAYANSHVIDEDGNIIGDYVNTEYLASLSTTKWGSAYKVSAEREINDGLGVKNTILNVSSALFRRFVIDPEIRNVLADMRIAGDWLFIIHAIRGGQIYYSPEKLNRHRRHAKSIIGQTVSKKRLEDFFGEFYLVQRSIVENYVLQPGFREKWEQYLLQLWGEFSPGRPFKEIEEYYPFDAMREKIASAERSK